MKLRNLPIGVSLLVGVGEYRKSLVSNIPLSTSVPMRKAWGLFVALNDTWVTPEVLAKIRAARALGKPVFVLLRGSNMIYRTFDYTEVGEEEAYAYLFNLGRTPSIREFMALRDYWDALDSLPVPQFSSSMLEDADSAF